MIDPAEGKPARMTVHVRRLYEDPASRRGRCFLVERLWPRGVRKDELGDVTWLKDVAPSNELRVWFGHDPERWPEFRARYRAELEAVSDALEPLLEAARQGDTTLLYTARDTERNSAHVLAEVLRERLG